MFINNSNIITFPKKSNNERALLIVDLQPEVDRFISNYDFCSLSNFINKYKKVIYVVDENVSGGNKSSHYLHPSLIEEMIDKEQILREFGYKTIEEAEEAEDWDVIDALSMCEIPPHIDLVVKSYGGILRTFIDHDLEDEGIYFFQDLISGLPYPELISKYDFFIEFIAEEYGLEDFENEEIIENFLVPNIKKGFITGISNELLLNNAPFDIAGGHRDFCVREITIALDIFDIDYRLLENLIYYKKRSSLCT